MLQIEIIRLLSLSLNISLTCFASSRFYVLSRTCKSWRHVITDRFPSTTTCVYTSLSTKQSISPTSFISHRTTPAWSSPAVSASKRPACAPQWRRDLRRQYPAQLALIIIIKPQRNTVLRFNEPQDRMSSIR